MAQTWCSHGSSNWFFLNHHQYAQGGFMPNFTVLSVSHGPLSLKWPKYGPFMAKTWSSHGPSNWFFLNLNHCAQGCSLPNFTLLGVSCNPFHRNGQNMALLWAKHGPHMVLQIGSSWILINVPRDVPCQITHCWVYHVAPIPRYGQTRPFYC